jgi:hypothetical protein
LARAIGEILDELKAALDDDSLVLSQQQAITDVQMCLELETVAHALSTRALKAVDDLDATVELCGRTTKSWLLEDVRMSKPEAGRRMKFVRFLDDFPKIKAAYLAAELSTEHVSALLSAMKSLPPAAWDAVEGPLVEMARSGSPADVADFVDDILTGLGATKKSDIQRERRNGALGFRLTRTLDGYYSASGLVDAATGEILRAALDLHNAKSGPDDLRSPMRRDHDALGTIARNALEVADQPSFTGSPVGVLVTIPYDVLENRLREAWLTLPSGMRISAETARRLACDAEIIPAVLGTNSEVLDIGRSTRQWTSAQRRAAWLEQGGRCAFPKCQRRCVELHHIEWWCLDGTTSLDNGAWLCAFHHWLVHEGRWTLRRGPDRSFIWTNSIGWEQIRHLTAA